MAIKKRPRAADIEKFGDAAEAAPPAPAMPPAAEPAREEELFQAPVRRTPTAAERRQRRSATEPWPEDLAKTTLIRYPDPSLPKQLLEVSDLLERSQHDTAVRAMRRGLAELAKDAGFELDDE